MKIKYEISNFMTLEQFETYVKENINPNSTIIDFGNCEKNLKNAYNISEESPLYMVQIDIEQEYNSSFNDK